MLAEQQSQGKAEVDDAALEQAREQLSSQIKDMEALTRQTWQDKQRASRKHEAEVARMRRAHMRWGRGLARTEAPARPSLSVAHR